jgi:predicted outer membrane protein
MRKTFLLPVAVLALAGLSACGGANNEAAEANETITGDSNTMGEAVSDVDAANAALDDAFAGAENSYAGNMTANGTDEGSGDAGNEITE